MRRRPDKQDEPSGDGLDHLRPGQRVSANFLAVALLVFVGAVLIFWVLIGQAD